MTEADWLDLLARISPHEPADVNDLYAPPTPPQAARDGAPPVAGAAMGIAPSSRLWHRHDGRQAGLGVRVTRPVADCAGAALRLGSVALERGLMPVILTTLPDCGFERFGFRIERLSDGSADQRRTEEAELSRFWSLAIIIDADDIALIG